MSVPLGMSSAEVSESVCPSGNEGKVSVPRALPGAFSETAEALELMNLGEALNRVRGIHKIENRGQT